MTGDNLLSTSMLRSKPRNIIFLEVKVDKTRITVYFFYLFCLTCQIILICYHDIFNLIISHLSGSLSIHRPSYKKIIGGQSILSIEPTRL
jgi:hypothetical protein